MAIHASRLLGKQRKGNERVFATRHIQRKMIVLAAELVAKGCVVLNPRGEKYTKENIGQRLGMRDFMDSLRSSGVQTGGPDAFSKRDRMTFANALDSVLMRR